MRIHHVAGIAVLLLAVYAGYLATSRVQRTVPLVPGIQGCWRLEGSARQTSCLSREFEEGAAASTERLTGARRVAAINGYVNRADRLAASDPQLAGSCHQAMHALGRSEGRRAAAASSSPEFPDGSTQLCTAGYVHGLSEGYLAGTPDADVAAVFPALCHDADARLGCAHGIGHALLRAQPSTSWTSAAPAAVQRCATLAEEPATSCDNGVYMELAIRTVPEPVPVATFTKVCSEAGSIDRQLACWGYLPSSLSSNDAALDETPTWCGKAPLPAQFPCIESYGRQLGATKVRTCEQRAGSQPLAQRCIDGAIGLQVGSGHISKAAATKACDQLSAAPLARYCVDAVGRYGRGRAAQGASA